MVEKHGKTNIQEGFSPKTIEAKTEAQKEEKMMRGVKKDRYWLKKHQELIKPKRFSF